LPVSVRAVNNAEEALAEKPEQYFYPGDRNYVSTKKCSLPEVVFL